MLCKRCSPSMWASKSICNAATWRRSVAASDAGGTINPSARRRGPTRSEGEGWWPAAGVGLLLLAPPKFGPILVKGLLPTGLSAGMTVDGGLQNATVLFGQELPPPGLVRPDMMSKLTQLQPPGTPTKCTATFHPQRLSARSVLASQQRHLADDEHASCFSVHRLSATLIQDRHTIHVVNWGHAMTCWSEFTRGPPAHSSSYKRHLHLQYSTHDALHECAITTTTLSTLQLTTQISRPRHVHVTFCRTDSLHRVNWHGHSPSRLLLCSRHDNWLAK